MTNLAKSTRSRFGKALTAVIATVSLGAATLGTVEPASAQFRGGGFHGGFGGGYGNIYRPHFGGGWRGGYGGFRGGYGGWHRGYGGYGRGIGYGLAGLGVGLALGGAYGGYGYGNGYYGTGYGGYGDYGADSCIRRVYGPYGPHWVNVCY